MADGLAQHVSAAGPLSAAASRAPLKPGPELDLRR